MAASDPLIADAESFADAVEKEGGGIGQAFCRRVYQAACFEGALRRRREQVATAMPATGSAQAKYEALESKFKAVEQSIAEERAALSRHALERRPSRLHGGRHMR